MTKHLKLLIVLLVAALGALVGLASLSVESAGTSEELLPHHRGVVQQEKTAEQAYKNIQVFKGVPAYQLLGAMNFMADSLGVSCNHCHVKNQFAKDDKPAKQIARQHILTMRAVNDAAFEGRTVVNCALSPARDATRIDLGC
jgi:hypothetical protein